MKRLVAHALAIAIGACAGIAAAQLNGGVMESQRAGTVAITSGAINGTTIGATTPASGSFTTLSTSSTVGIVHTSAATGGPTVTNSNGGTTADAAYQVSNGTNGGRFGYAGTAYTTYNGITANSLFAYTANAAGINILADNGSATIRLSIAGTTVGTVSSTGLAITGNVTSTTAGALKGSATNDAASAGNIGELLTTTVASGSAVSLTTATSANIATLSLTAGDWDCNAQVTHNAAATTSVTLLQIGISATTATLPTQAGGSGIGTDPLAIWRQAAAVPGGALTTSVGPVRVSLSGTTNVFLVANDTFTVSTMTGYGTIRCRRMR